jgi:malonate transporter
MSMLYTVFKASAPIFFVLFLGFRAGKSKLVDSGNVSVLNVFLMDFALPSSLFLSTVQTPWSGILELRPLILVLAFSMWLTYAFMFLLSARLWKKAAPEAAVLSLTASLPNYAALGLPILNGVLGEGPASSLSAAVAVSCGAALITPVCLASLEAGKAGSGGGAFLLPKLVALSFKKPIVWAPVAGVAASALLEALGAKVPEAAVIALKPLGAAALGTALFLTGVILSARKGRLSLPVILSTAVKNVAMPSLAWLVAYLLGVDPRTARTGILLTALSAGFFGVLFGNRYGVRSPDAEGALLAGTVAFAATIPLFIALTAGITE